MVGDDDFTTMWMYLIPLNYTLKMIKMVNVLCILPQLKFLSKIQTRTSLAVQWLRLCLPTQGMRVQSLVRGLRSHMPPSQTAKPWNRSNVVTGASPMARQIKNLPVMQKTQEMRVWSLCWEDPLEEGMATRSNIFAWKIPWTEEPGGLQSRGSQRVRHNWACTHACNFVTNFKNGQHQKFFLLKIQTDWCRQYVLWKAEEVEKKGKRKGWGVSNPP